jgi:streptomycin 6-kinase
MGALEAFRAAVEARVGDAAIPWAAGLRALRDDLVERWQLALDDARGGASGFFATGTRGDEPILLRLAYPDGWFAEEVVALRAWGGHGVVSLREHDERGAQLLARPLPGIPLAELADPSEALERVAAVAERLWVEAPDGVTALADEAREWARTMTARHHLAGRPFERELVNEAVEVLRDLLATAPRGVLVHGDLTRAHVVDAGPDGDVATDPRPLVGEPAFDAASLLRDVAADPGEAPAGGAASERADLLQHRFDRLRSRLAVDGARLKSWALVVAVDEAIWDYEQDAASLGRTQVEVARRVRALQV